MPNRLSDEEEAKRRALYDAGLNDDEMADRLHINRRTVEHWRFSRKLPSNRKRNFREKVEKPKTETKNMHGATLCWTCRNTNADKCPWFVPGEAKPVEGWVAEKTVIYYSGKDAHYATDSYHVISCPNYDPISEDRA